MKVDSISFIIVIAVIAVVIFVIVRRFRSDNDRHCRDVCVSEVHRGPSYRYFDPNYKSCPIKKSSHIRNEPIDVVYCWIDGNHDSTKKLLAKWSKIEGINISRNRTRDNNELLYSIKSVLKFAPWVRNIYVVSSNGRSPEWWDEHFANTYSNDIPNLLNVDGVNNRRIEVIDDSELMPKEALPTFNSCAKELCLWKIKGLSEHFWYFNDDMILGSPASKADLFHPDGKIKVFLEDSQLKHSLGEYESRGILMTDDVLDERFGIYNNEARSRSVHRHAAYIHKKSVYQKIWQDYSDLVEETVHSRFRKKNNLQCNVLFTPWFMIHSGMAKESCMKTMHISVGPSPEDNQEAYNMALTLRPKQLCINDDIGNPGSIAEEEITEGLQQFMQKLTY